jgi:hypothetical protein
VIEYASTIRREMTREELEELKDRITKTDDDGNRFCKEEQDAMDEADEDNREENPGDYDDDD